MAFARVILLLTFSTPSNTKHLENRSSSQMKHKIKALGANSTKWSNTLKQFVGSLPRNWLSVFGHFVGLALQGLNLYTDKFHCSHISRFVFLFAWYHWKNKFIEGNAIVWYLLRHARDVVPFDYPGSIAITGKGGYLH